MNTYRFEVTFYNGISFIYTCNADNSEEALVKAREANWEYKTIKLL